MNACRGGGKDLFDDLSVGGLKMVHRLFSQSPPLFIGDLCHQLFLNFFLFLVAVVS